jgi:ABC-type glycerol-3-phosphate transport system substrate-binding protein
VRFGYVPPPFGALWPDIEALLDKAVAKGGNRWGDVKAALARETAQLWLTMDDGPVNATVTRMDGKTLEIWLCGRLGRSVGSRAATSF